MKKGFFYISLFIISWVYSVTFNCADWDLWARLAVGKIFFQLGTVLKNDIFSYTPTKDMWVDHEWGSGVVFYFIQDHFGDIGLMLLKIIGLFIILFLISKIIELRNKVKDSHLNLFLYFIMILTLFNGLGGTVRCQMFTFVFFALWIYVLERIRINNENRLLWIFPVTSVIWANLHGGFVSGLGLLLIYGVGEFLNKKSFSKYFLIFIPSVLTTFINPYGYKYLEFLLHATTMARPTITEWYNTELFDSLNNWKGYKILFGLTVFTMIFSFIKDRPKFKDIDKVKYLLIFVTLYLSLKHIKHHTFYAIVAGGFLYHDFYSILAIIKIALVSKFGEITNNILNKLAMAKDFIVYSFIIIAGVLLIYTTPVKVILFDTEYPIGSIEFVKINNLSGNLLTLFHWGSYAIWKLYPQCLLAEDGRYEETYSESIHLKVFNFNYMIDDKWDTFLKEHKTDIVIIAKNKPSYIEMLNSKYWKLIYDDKISAVFVPIDKVKKTYLMPKYTEDSIAEKKYINSIDFIN